MSSPTGSILHQQALTVLGFFTGFTLTALVLILNAPAAFHTPIWPLSGQDYFELVATYVAVVGAMSCVGILAYLEVAGGLSGKYSLLDSFGTALFLISVFAFMGSLPLLLVPFTRYGAASVLAVEIFLVGSYFVVRRMPPLKRRTLARGPTPPSSGSGD